MQNIGAYTSNAVPAAPDLVQSNDAMVLHDALQLVSDFPCRHFELFWFMLDQVKWVRQTDLALHASRRRGRGR